VTTALANKDRFGFFHVR